MMSGRMLFYKPISLSVQNTRNFLIKVNDYAIL